MARICGRDTRPELAIRRALHARGLRYRLHRKDLPGRPDIVFPARRAVIMVHGCFWHGHSPCPLFRWPKGNEAFWRDKIGRNRERDGRILKAIEDIGWRVLTVWECAMRGPGRLPADDLINRVEAWIHGGEHSDSVP